MKRFDESRVELEKVLKMAQNFLTERGNPEELLKKHTVSVLCKNENAHHIEPQYSKMHSNET